MRRSATHALFAVVTALGAIPAAAQSIPEGQSCGGILCDMGVFGHKTAPAAASPMAVTPVPSPQAGRRAEALPPESAAPEPRKRTARKKHIAKAVAAPVDAKPVAAGPRPSAAVAAAARPAAPVRATPAQAAPAVPPASAANVTMNPFVQQSPAAAQFRPLY